MTVWNSQGAPNLQCESRQWAWVYDIRALSCTQFRPCFGKMQLIRPYKIKNIYIKLMFHPKKIDGTIQYQYFREGLFFFFSKIWQLKCRSVPISFNFEIFWEKNFSTQLCLKLIGNNKKVQDSRKNHCLSHCQFLLIKVP